MPRRAGSEFRRDIKPIETAFRTGAMPEALVADAASAAERFSARLMETVFSRPLWISPARNKAPNIRYARGQGW